jgi:putative Ca2+/H+ antiporter (TMEM165/GDT1 family)
VSSARGAGARGVLARHGTRIGVISAVALAVLIALIVVATHGRSVAPPENTGPACVWADRGGCYILGGFFFSAPIKRKKQKKKKKKKKKKNCFVACDFFFWLFFFFYLVVAFD